MIYSNETPMAEIMRSLGSIFRKVNKHQTYSYNTTAVYKKDIHINNEELRAPDLMR